MYVLILAGTPALREVFLPYYKEFIGFFKDYGLPVILHTCGDVRKAVPLIIETGFDYFSGIRR